jgi:glycosyltransferase involved in cell wall biosynthesis
VSARSVSVVIPVHNGARWLRASLDSILAQTYPILEIIVMDDASDDGSAEIASSYGKEVRIHRQPTVRGQFDNVNDGITQAVGDYVCVFHADDVYAPTIVESEAAFLDAHPTVGAVFCQDVFIGPDSREFGRLRLPSDVPVEVPLNRGLVLDRLLRHRNVFLRCPTAMIRADVYRDVGHYDQRSFPVAADLDMWVRIARRHDLAILDQHLLRYRYGHGSVGAAYQRLRTEPDDYFAILDREIADVGREALDQDALAAHDSHRAEDWLNISVSRYVRDDMTGARAALRMVRARQLAAGRPMELARPHALLVAMWMVTRTPRSERLARTFYRRWHERHLKPDFA